MARRREIKFTIDSKGDVKLEFKGQPGPDCEKLTREIEMAIGIVTNRQHTSEYYVVETAKETVSTGEG